MDDELIVDVLIIGAGISGLICATELQNSGLQVVLLDKGRRAGGRLSTRDMQGARVDHGAQFFTVRDPRFQNYVDQWINSGVIREWFQHADWDTNAAGYPRYCGVTGMNSIAKHLARTLDVHQSEEVVKLSRRGDCWVANSKNDNKYAAKKLIITAPLPQALALMETSNLNWAGDWLPRLKRVRYDKGLAALVLLDQPSLVPAPGALKLSNGPLVWIADNQMKGISPDVTALTLHASAKFATKHWDSSDAVRGQLMLNAAKQFIQGQVLDLHCHRWGFTMPLNPWPQAYLSMERFDLVLAGDAFGGPRIEGAALSGFEAAGAILQCF